MGCDCHANCPYHQLDKNNELSKDCSKFIRIIDDLEISNNSLLHINMSLEDTVRHQALIIEKLQRNLKKLSDDDTIVPTVVDSKANSVIQNDRHSLAYEVLSQKVASMVVNVSNTKETVSNQTIEQFLDIFSEYQTNLNLEKLEDQPITACDENSLQIDYLDNPYNHQLKTAKVSKATAVRYAMPTYQCPSILSENSSRMS